MDRVDCAHRLIDRIYEAAVSPEAWNHFVAELSQAYGGAAVLLALNFPPAAPQRYGVGLIEEFRDSYLEHMVKGLPWSSVVLDHYMGRFGDGGEVFPDVDLRRSGFYTAWMKPQKLAPVWPMVHTLSLDKGVPAGGLILFRPQRGKPFDEDDFAFGDLLVPHLSRALNVYRTLSGVERERIALAEVVDRLPTGVIVLDAQRRPVVTNRSADRIIGLQDGFGIGPNGPYASAARENAAMQKLIADALEAAPGRELEVSGFMAIPRPSERRAFTAWIAALMAAPAGSAGGDAVIALFISDPEAGQVSATEVLETVYSLTRAEAELVRLLSQGHSLDTVAELRGITMNTARSHLKRVFAKTDTKRQGELVRLVLTGVASIREM